MRQILNPLILVGLVVLLAPSCDRERRNPLDPETNIIKERLPPPQGMAATPGRGFLRLQWLPISSRLLAGYALFRAEQLNGDYTWVRGDGNTELQITTSKTTFVDSVGLPVRTYFYRIASVDTTGRLSQFSHFAAATPLDDRVPPTAPLNLSAVADENKSGRLILRWNVPVQDVDGSELSGLAGFVILRAEANRGFLAPVDTVDAQTLEYIDENLKAATLYAYAIQSFDPAGNYSPSSLSVQARTQGVAMPTGVQAIGQFGRIVISWNPILEEDLWGYNVYRAQQSDTGYERLGSPEALFTTGNTVYLDSSVTTGERFFYKVSGISPRGESELSLTVNAAAQTDRLGPGSPIELVGVGQVGQVELRWNAPLIDRDGGPLTGLSAYVIYRGESQTSLAVRDSVGAGLVEYVDTQVEGPHTYYYGLVALDGLGNRSPLSEVIAVQVPGLLPPQGVEVQGGIGFIQVRWQGSQEEGLWGYNVYRSTRSDGGYERLGSGSFTTGETVFVDSTAQAGQLYFYQVTAVGAGLESKPSAFRGDRAVEDLIGPSNPQGLLAVGQTGQVRLSWNAPLTDRDGGALSGLSGYVIYRGESETSLAILDTVGAAEETYLDQSVEAATTYFYAVAALDAAGHSSPLSPLVSATTPGILPVSGLSATSGIERIELRWDRNLNEDLWGYNVYRAARSDGEYARLAGNEGTPFTTGRTAYIDSNLTGGQVFFYKVSAVTSGGESALSEFAGTSALRDTRPPAAPIPLDIRPVADNPEHLQLSWKAPITDVDGAELTGLSRYQIYRAQDSAGPFVLVGNSTSTAFLDTGLTARTTYFYQLEALDENGNASPRSSVLSATTNGVALPQRVRISSTTPSDPAQPPVVTISWDASEGAIAQYEVQRATVPDSDRDIDYLEILPHTSATSRQDSSAVRGTTYYYRVRARDAENRISDWTEPQGIFVSP